MSSQQRPASQAWLLFWVHTYVLAFAVVGLLPIAGGLPLPPGLGTPGSVLTQFYFLVINAFLQGLFLGLGQWLLLRNQGLASRRFVLLTTLGWVLGLSLGLWIIFGISRLVPDLSQVSSPGAVSALNFGLLIFNSVPFFVAGLVLGGFQWLGLRRDQLSGPRWVLASGLGFLFFLLVRNGFTYLGGIAQAPWIGAPLGLWVASLVPGLVTGGILARSSGESGLAAGLRKLGLVQPVVILLVSLVSSFMASEIGRAVELARASRPASVVLSYESGLPADGEREVRLQAQVLNRQGQALPGQNVKFQIENRDLIFEAADGSQGVLPVDEGCIVVEEQVCLPSAIVQSGPDGIAEVRYRTPTWEAFMLTEPIRFHAQVFQRDPDSTSGPAAQGEIYFAPP